MPRPFSFAYLQLHRDRRTDPLWAVQLTMIGAGLRSVSAQPRESGSLGSALGGLVQSPGQCACTAWRNLMGLAGIAWDLFTARQARVVRPPNHRKLPGDAAGLLLAAVWLPRAHLSTVGILCAVASGALVSEAARYAVLPG
jgi:hypothetical protein